VAIHLTQVMPWQRLGGAVPLIVVSGGNLDYRDFHSSAAGGLWKTPDHF
jgi:hypothetical protein